jgi:hypothetical protein
MFRKAIILSVSLSIVFSCAAVAAAFQLPDTGQTKCYQTVSPYAEIPCAGTGQDGEYSINPMSYTDNLNGTVTDNNTGLTWQRQDVADTHNWYEATGTYDATYNATSYSVCGSLPLGGYTDWRLPSKKELITIIDYSISYPEPTINNTYFPNTSLSPYWSSTPVASYTSIAWTVGFAYGWVSSDNKYQDHYVRCVRGGPYPSQSFMDNGNKTVTDNKTGLIWQQEQGKGDWDFALSYCKGLTLANQSDWRLPNIREIESLSDVTRYNPAIDSYFFPNTGLGYYWSSTTFATNPANAEEVTFNFGSSGDGSKFYNFDVRCVRGGYGSLVNLTITKDGYGEGSVTADSGAISWSGNTGTASYLFETQVILSPTPDASSLFGGWSGGGCSGAGNCTVTMDGDITVTATFNLKPARIAGSTPTYCDTLQEAHDGAVGGNTIEAEGIVFPESLTVSKPLTLMGGYDNSYSSSNGFTMVQGLTIRVGALTVENLVIR